MEKKDGKITMMVITLWSKPNCVQCEMTKKEFKKRGIIYRERRLDRSPKAVARFQELGFLSAPIIESDTKRWSGFKLDKIKSLDTYLKSERAKSPKPEPMVQVADEVDDE
jgi:glutaredoxin-like protein NrdH